jgi:hypothetical protein
MLAFKLAVRSARQGSQESSTVEIDNPASGVLHIEGFNTGEKLQRHSSRGHVHIKPATHARARSCILQYGVSVRHLTFAGRSPFGSVPADVGASCDGGFSE